MSDRIVLISDDSDFFDYVRLKLELRKSDELYTYAFDDVPDKLHFLEESVLIINSESSKEKTLELLKIFKGTPSIVISFNEDEQFKKKCYRAGLFDYMTLLTPDSEFRARILPALSMLALLEKNRQYRKVLVQKKVLTQNNEVFIDYSNIIDNELAEIKKNVCSAVFVAIAPNENTKFLFQPNVIETVILNNIRRNDILMNYAPNKYFLIMHDIDINSANKIWGNIQSQFSQKIYAGITKITNQSRQQIINDALNKLHEAIVHDKIQYGDKNSLKSLKTKQSSSPYSNFKLYRQQFSQKLEQVIAPVFYQIQQKYVSKLAGITIEQGSGDGYGVFYLKGKHLSGSFRVTSPGFAKINIDITMQKNSDEVDTKRITLEPEELEQGLLEDLLEQFISEVKG